MKRNSNIELLRIISILGVIILHYNNQTMGGALRFVTPNSTNYWILMFLESIFICAVNVFVIISGYFLIQKQSRNLWKIIELISQVILIQFAFYIFKDCIINHSFSPKGLIRSLIPANYFVILYSTLFIISPYINKLLNNISLKQYKNLLILLFILFSIYPTAIDLLSNTFNLNLKGLSTISISGSQSGYTIVNFILMYIIGGYIHKTNCVIKRNKLIIYFIFNLILIVGLSYFNADVAWEYCSPFVIIEAILTFMIFKEFNINSKIINLLAKGSFFVFLLHDKFLSIFHIKSFVVKPFFILILHVILSAVVIYAICYISFIIYDRISSPLLKWIKSKIKLPEINVD